MSVCALGSSASRWPSSSKATVVQQQSHQGPSSHNHAHPSSAVAGAVWGGGRTGRSPALPSPQEAGPTMVGDEHSDPTLMSFLGATKRNMLGNHFWEYYVNDAPRIVLDKLESRGYRVVSMTGVGQTLVWCLHKE
nr:GTP cyclohydrolase 1 feedback regulatory protein [Columba livia]